VHEHRLQLHVLLAWPLLLLRLRLPRLLLLWLSLPSLLLMRLSLPRLLSRRAVVGRPLVLLWWLERRLQRRLVRRLVVVLVQRRRRRCPFWLLPGLPARQRPRRRGQLFARGLLRVTGRGGEGQLRAVLLQQRRLWAGPLPGRLQGRGGGPLQRGVLQLLGASRLLPHRDQDHHRLQHGASGVLG
jgi:hypothetical protein